MSHASAFTGTDHYIASDDLMRIVDVAVSLQRPLLVKGEPGTGKTLLAHAIADGLGMEILTWHIKSTSRAQDGLYVYDTVQRLHDSRFDDKKVDDISAYIHLGPLGRAFASETRLVLLIDEIDKADVEFPNDLLHELDAMRFLIPETGEEVIAKQRPVVIITSNSEKELPDAFLRRSIFHYIAFPDRALMADIVHVHFPDLGDTMLERAMDAFYALRGVDGLRKKPSTSELLDWLGALISAGIAPESLAERVPMLGTLIKREQDLSLLARAANDPGRRHR
jgi:MoxR-like ATPase